MALRVPKQQIPFLQRLLELSDDKTSELLAALGHAGHKFNVYDLASDVAAKTKLPKGLVEGILQILASLYTTKDSQSTALDAFVDDQIRPAVIGALEESENRWIKLRAFLVVALSLDDTVGVAAKVGRVMTEHERIFVNARFLTDIRPIFHLDLSEKPTAGVIVHMLRLTTRDPDGKETSNFFALDSNDIRLVKDLIDRAIKKEGTLKDLMKQANVDMIEPGTIF